jgi:probable poly-beta-1,6-N-acetyl-D-glucosamine export protein
MSSALPIDTQMREESSVVVKERKRPHVYELDPLRGITALMVVAVHTLGNSTFLNHTVAGLEVQYMAVTALHFTRALFMFVTAFALVYVYFGRKFSLGQFWKKRSIGAVLPYCIWSIVYVLVDTPNLNFASFLHTSFIDILTGNASYQMYYILLTLQFYLILPLFLWFFRKVERYPWRTLVISFVIQMIIFYLDYHYVQIGSWSTSPIAKILNQYQDRIVFMYQFYFILGAFVARYFEQVRAFILRHGIWIACGMIVVLAGLWAHYFIQVLVYHEAIVYAVSVLQPSLVIYSAAIVIFSFWLACRWVVKSTGGVENKKPSWYGFWHQLSDASFGVYLIHVLILTALLDHLAPVMPVTWPLAIRLFLLWFITAGGAALISILLANIPVLSRLVGRSRPLPTWFPGQRKGDRVQQRA